MSPLPSVVQVSSSASSIPTLVTAATFKALQSLRPGGRFKSLEQAQATQLVHLRDRHVLAVMPTNAGKTGIVSVNVKLESKAEPGRSPMITVMLAPTTSLLEDLKDRFEKEHIAVVLWTGTGTHALGIVLVSYESAVSVSFLDYCRALAKEGRLARFVVDECHYPRSNLHFRSGMLKLNQLVNVGVPMLLLTGSLPPVAVSDTLKFFGIDEASVIRMRTGRPNIRYSSHYDRLPYDSDPLEHAYTIVKNLTATHPLNGRIIIYCYSKDLVNYLCARNEDWWPYHADTNESEKKRCIRDWNASDRNIVVATSAFSVGIDRPDVNWVVHLGAPQNMDQYIQESGRAGRGGADAEAQIITWRPTQDPNINVAGSEFLRDFISSQLICRRIILEGYADGYSFNCFSQPMGTVLCDNCERQNAAQAATTYIAPQTVGPSILQNAATAAQRNAPIQYAALLHRLQVLTRKCKSCYVKGAGLQSHNWKYCQHPAPEVKSEYQRWKDSISFSQQRRREPICYKCHLPFDSDAFHRPQVDEELVAGRERQKVCLFEDQLWVVYGLGWVRLG
jgi:superfamily II DNA or RNA helicase